MRECFLAVVTNVTTFAVVWIEMPSVSWMIEM